MGKIVRIGTRESRLAIIQAQLVADAIQKDHPDIDVRLVPMKTTGDKIQDRTLDKVGGKGLFIKELDAALRRGEVDICAHSYKDMPVEDDPDLPVVAVGQREDARDVLILPLHVTEAHANKPIGCSSQRRQVQLQSLFPGQTCAPARGNVLTRLEKLDRGEYSALVLAAAGIVRLGLWERVSRAFSPEELLPAGCQGVIAVQGRVGENYDYLQSFHCADAWDITAAERAYIRRLSSGCGAPVGVFGELDGATLRLRGLFSRDGQVYTAEISADRKLAEQAGVDLADLILERAGAECITPGTSH